MSGISTNDLETRPFVDELLANADGTTVKITISDLLRLMPGEVSGPVYQTYAELAADLVWVESAVALVWGDDDEQLRGLYRKINASGAGSWTRYADPPISAVAIADAYANAQAAKSYSESYDAQAMANAVAVSTANASQTQEDKAQTAIARNEAETAAQVAGISHIYSSFADADAAKATLAEGDKVAVLADETLNGVSSVYVLSTGALSYFGPFGQPVKYAHDGNSLSAHPECGVIVHVGDSNTQSRPGYRNAYEADWLAKDGLFEGWTSYNLGANGSTAQGWAGGIDTKTTTTPPKDFGPSDTDTSDPAWANAWAVVNADPDVIMFSLGTNDWRLSTSSAADVNEFTANVGRLINFFLARTRATIVMHTPQPLAYANPDPDGFTDFVDADDAAARSAAMRGVYLSWINKTSRVKVVDLHRSLFGLRLDSVAAAQDPYGQGDLMDDTLHCLDLGYTRKVQFIGRELDKSIPASPLLRKVSPSLAGNIYWSATMQVVGAGNGYLDIKKDPLSPLGSFRLDKNRESLRNVRLAEALLLTDAPAKVRQLMSLPLGCSMIALDDGTTGSLVAVTATDDRPVQDEWRILASSSGDLSAFAGKVVTFYATAPNQVPRIPEADATPYIIPLNGPQPLAADAIGMLARPFGKGAMTAIYVDGARESSSGSAVVDLFIINQVDGRFVDGTGTFAWPGKRLGTLTFNTAYRLARNTEFVVDAANWPSGISNLSVSGTNFAFVAKVISGTIGKFGSVTVRPY